MKILKYFSLSLVSIILILLAPSPAYAINCTASGGYTGVCQDRNTTSCSGYYEAGFCPGAASIQCCVTGPVKCYPPAGVGACRNRTGSQSYACTGGNYYPGYCPGPADVQCCVQPQSNPTATPTPTPTKTPPGPTATPTNVPPGPTSTPTPTPTPPLPPGVQSTTPGIILSGNGKYDFNQGHASPSPANWIVGGLTYPESYPTLTNPSTTSYNYLSSKLKASAIVPTDLTSLPTCLNLSNCSLPANLTNGVYQANGSLTLNVNANTFQTGKNYIFLIKGDLTIFSNIVVPNGSTVLFSANNDILVDKSIGAAAYAFPAPTGQIQGLFSADRNFTIQGTNDCLVGADKMLNAEGAIITNAAGAGGTFTNSRDLCGNNPNYPAFTIRLRLDFLLNAPEIIMRRDTTLREVAP